MSNGASAIVDQMYEKDRILIMAALDLQNGHFLQPTGFPDIGYCVYVDADGKRRCIVESEQSMANRLEAVSTKAPGHWVDALSDLPVIEVRDKHRNLLATNLTEPHRIASSYILEGKLEGDASDVKAKFETQIGLLDDGARWPLDGREKLEKLIFALDPAALLHGFQFVQWNFVGLRQTRLLSARLECELSDEPDVDYGMVKFDRIDPEAHPKKSNKGQSIAAKRRLVAAKDGITATFDLDVLGLKSLALTGEQKKFLLSLALWKISAFLSNQPGFDARSGQTGPALRLRTDCYLHYKDVGWSDSAEKGGRKTFALERILDQPPDGQDFKALASAQNFALKKDNGKLEPLRITYDKSITQSQPTPMSADAVTEPTAMEIDADSNSN